ncbi:MAG: hypothetical protein F4Y91_02625 [Gemmatimonadetes bacterium]|nr:hypothetical protein [Gemmatimonadota bacterium]MXY80984.1 hypothetical protein [Gemmatimonadota bacterium]MYB67689.1 hypothetical protein [Gemmatimonadota bacterium]
MAKIKVNKPEAARRQIDAAIRMLFSGEDPVAVHTLAMASFRVLRDLAKHTESPTESLIDSIIRPEKKTKLWKHINSLSNFLKHADNDPYEIHDPVGEEINDVVLLLACQYYQDLGYQHTHEMSTLITWCMVLYPEFLLPDTNPQLREMVEALDADRNLPRKEKLARGLQLLCSARRM